MQGINDALFALSKGASLIEKHFTINKNLPGRDNKFAILPNELAILSNYNKNLKKFGKKKGLGLLTCEKDIFKNYRGRWSKKIN
jgi:sialic acid synthase SpsE